MKEFWTSLASLMGVFAFCQSLLHAVFPPELRFATAKLFNRLFNCFSSYCYFDITEIDGVNTNELYNAVQVYLSSSASVAGSRLSLTRALNSSAFTFGLSNNDRLVDTFRGATATWEHVVTQRQAQTFSWRPLPDEKRGFTLRIEKKDKPLILQAYLDHIMDTANDIRRRNQDRLLYTNSRGGAMDSRGHPWESVPFKHPSTFDTLAMDPSKKEEIMADLRDFAEGNAFYQKTGRAWKRGYLLYGPPGTGKSSMIAAMANFLGYDIYDLELTEVHTNSELRKLLMKTTSKSIIVIEDIDCSINLTNRSSKKPPNEPPSEFRAGPGARTGPDDATANSITLSGLLNFTDGLWSCCGSERIFVFTTNRIEKLDPALLRSGRMDMHIFMSYCSFPALKILMKNYLGFDDGELDGEEDGLLKQLEEVIDEAEITPADVSELLIKNRRREKREAIKELLEVLKSRRVEKKKPGSRSAAARKKRLNEELEEEEEEEEEEQEKRALESPKDGGEAMDMCNGKEGGEKGDEN
ncbi:AAA-ATPase At4g25835 [Phoenix dactylifera]|uniref:AAA-ATPase At4g25835 n=1 Tax=Phoenix dactylifera TaxID=42345 RepID=A0A8B7D1U9_PHODC|nr:AAA-ATPase At4g25835 [Phoenix dactylifera]XP_008811305.1 AAA-ATPase At4g25835 [Phoenix dactylifera]XP_017702008.1 AAA-ATPase At4g25835 [Phoenix dactylifera]XP_038981598.1 AAA-ATPase At4g25835 [Phoenix dactylifera]